MPVIEACRDCRFWQARPDASTVNAGDCRRYPNGLRKIAHEWCGEFVAAIELPARIPVVKAKARV